MDSVGRSRLAGASLCPSAAVNAADGQTGGMRQSKLELGSWRGARPFDDA
jgi:hypothetical protein